MADRTLFVGPVDRVLYFRTVPAFEGLGPAQLAAIAHHAQEVFVAAGDHLIRRHAPVDAFYLIAEGRAAVERPGQPPSALGPGDAVGFVHLLARAHAGLEARALEDTLALRLDWDAQLDLLEEHFPILLQVVRFLAAGVQEALAALPPGTRLGGAPLPAPTGPQPLHMVDRLLALLHAPTFPDTAIDALAELARHVREVRVPAGATVWEAGDPADHFLQITAGSIRGSVPGTPWTISMGAGQAIGLTETLRAATRWHAAVAEEAVVALEVRLDPFLDILEDHFDLALEFTSVLARRLLTLSGGPSA